MKKKNTKTLFLAVTVTFVFTMANIFVPDGDVKFVINCISAVVAVYGIISGFFSHVPVVRRLDHHLQKIEFFRLLLRERTFGAVLKGPVFNKFKSKVLSYTIDQLGNRTELIKGPEIFNIDFPIENEFKSGTSRENQLEDWKKHLDKQFVFITGVSGNGKTFELMKRASYLCKKLTPGIENYDIFEKSKVPLYIELKSLNGPLNADWIIDYISKSSVITKQEINEEQVRTLIADHEVVYFFDGLDEVEAEYRIEATKQIVELSEFTGVHVTCRDNIYGELVANNIILKGNLPVQFILKPLTKEWVTEIILELGGYRTSEKQEMALFVKNRPTLFEHFSRPILLNLFVIVYHNLDEEEKKALGSSDENETMKILWENYEDFIVRKKLPKDIDILGMRTITVWLAKIMGNKSFYIESIQPSWLKRIHESSVEDYPLIQRFYYFTTRILSAVIVGIALACIISTPFALISNSILGGVIITGLAGIYNHKFKKFKLPIWISSSLFYLSMIAFLTLGCGLYQGFSVPRALEEMTNPFFSETECWPGILLGITLSVVFSYRIIMEKVKQQYILPIELFHFDWPHAFRYGLSWGFVTAMTTGSIAIYVKHKFASGRFIKDWLIPNVKKILLRLDIDPRLDLNVDAAVFAYAFIVTFLIASLIIVLMAGRNPSNETFDETTNKQKLNFGIKRSARHAFRHASRVSLTVFVFYTILVLSLNLGSWVNAMIIACGVSILLYLWFGGRVSNLVWTVFIVYTVLVLVLHLGSWVNGSMITVGVFILVFLWFGGMEVINHIALRINLYLRGIAPLNYNTWVQAQQNMGLVIPSGYQMSFYHSTLANYYANIPFETSNRVRLKKDRKTDVFIYFSILIFCLGLLAAPFLLRYCFKIYWKGTYEVNMSSSELIKENDSAYVFEKTGKYLASASGMINVGTFVGWSSAAGTKYGFLGMPVDSVYNVPGLGVYDHAALLFRLKDQSGQWSNYKYLSKTDTLNIRKGDRMEVLVNDKEWQNNTGRYNAQVNFCNNCK